MVLTASQAWDAIISNVRSDLGDVDEADVDALIAGLLRRAAAARSPCTRPDLIEALTESLAGLAPPEIATRENLDRVLDDLLVAGDLIEVERDMGRPIIYLGPPRFVLRRTSILVMGGHAGTGLPLLPELRARLSSRHAQRFLRLGTSEEATAALETLGYFPYPMDAWTACPDVTDPSELLRRLETHLAVAGRAGDVPELIVLDHSQTNRHYRSRWKPPRDQSGRYVGRRPQRWGAPLWCYVELQDGSPTRLVDLPVVDRTFRACDEAWWIQFAIDAVLGHPQEMRIRDAAEEPNTISLRMPLPTWAARRLLLVGDLLPRAQAGYLFTYGISEREMEEEVTFLDEHLWCRRTDE
jgi:hypothetical protein